MKRFLWLGALATSLLGQEAPAGFELRSTLSAMGAYSNIPEMAPRLGSDFVGGVRAVLYPTWKINSHWAVSAAVQGYTRPFFLEQFNTQGSGAKVDVLQAHLSYNHFWGKNSVVVRVGQLSSAFGSFLLRYDDAANALIGLPQAYGYYYKGVTTLGLPGAEVDLTLDKLDLRGQFTASSPSNRRGLLDGDQYGSWTGGGGYTIMQGFRVGGSVNYGPYLHRKHRFYFPGELKPKDLPETAYGFDVQFARGHWTLNGEWQRFYMPYKAIADTYQRIGYFEVKRVLHPRWYVAVRPGYLRSNKFAGDNYFEFVAGFRPNRRQLIKAGYIGTRNSKTTAYSNSFIVQLVTSLDPLYIAKD